MKLYELLNVVISDYMIGVNKGTEFIEEFDSSNIQKRTKYRESLVTSVHILNEETIAINVEISWWNSHFNGRSDQNVTTRQQRTSGDLRERCIIQTTKHHHL